MSAIGIKHKLPVFHAVKETYSTLFRNLPTLSRIVWLWMVVMLPIALVFDWLTWPLIDHTFLSGNGAAAQNNAPDMTSFLTAKGVSIAGFLLLLPFVSSIAIAWHRFVVSGEEVSAGSYFRLDGLVWKYGAFALLFYLIIEIVGVLLFAGPSLAKSSPGGYILFLFAAWLLIIVDICVIARLSVILPAIALDRQGATLMSVWRATHGNTWRILFGTFLCSLPICVLAAFVASYTLPESQLQYAIGGALATLITPILIMVNAGFLSFVYRYFFVSDMEHRPVTFAERNGPFGLAIK